MQYSLFLIPIVLFVFWYLNKKSKNNYFYNPKEEDYELVKRLYENFEIDFSTFDKAWKYFVKNPSEYNGTSVINDRWMIRGLEPMSVEHDYNWIIAKSLKDLLKANLDYCKKLRKVNANWFWVWGFIFCGLNVVALFYSVKFIKFVK